MEELMNSNIKKPTFPFIFKPVTSIDSTDLDQGVLEDRDHNFF